jgi:hypothetical protein
MWSKTATTPTESKGNKSELIPQQRQKKRKSKKRNENQRKQQNMKSSDRLRASVCPYRLWYKA